ncbi:hypothetical protein [Alkalihalobacillus sp. AL-G]|uniref:hypothetical protein n=1 Tax=Alkalihalobacillus sp. AL-G TaxID=2926399 RepID=UPI00272C8EAD|nr:hypothetical protein [Alkalihalobacillus sp. AL-G]WLD91734.1 hypothetical protein MOJ78_11840 [Alkalihalobacillus sp. AL-G]
MDGFWVLLGLLALLALPILWGIIKSKFGIGNQFYGDEMNKKAFKRTKRDESYEKTTSASRGQDGPFGNG